MPHNCVVIFAVPLAFWAKQPLDTLSRCCPIYYIPIIAITARFFHENWLTRVWCSRGNKGFTGQLNIWNPLLALRIVTSDLSELPQTRLAPHTRDLSCGNLLPRSFSSTDGEIKKLACQNECGCCHSLHYSWKDTRRKPDFVI